MQPTEHPSLDPSLPWPDKNALSKAGIWVVHSGLDTAPYSPMRAAQWLIKPKWLEVLGIKLPRSSCGPQSLASFGWGTKLFNCPAHLDFKMLSDEMTQITIVKRVILHSLWCSKKMYPPFYSCFFHNVSLWEKVTKADSASEDLLPL